MDAFGQHWGRTHSLMAVYHAADTRVAPPGRNFRMFLVGWFACVGAGLWGFVCLHLDDIINDDR